MGDKRRRRPMAKERRFCDNCGLFRAPGDLRCVRCGRRMWRIVPAPGAPKKPRRPK